MAEQTTSSIVIAADAASVMEVIADFRSYPEWAQGVKRAEPVGAAGRPPPGGVLRARREPDQGRLHPGLRLARDDEVSWTLVEGKMLKAMDGAYLLDDRGDGTTEVTYRLAVEISIPMIGMLKRKAEKVIIDTALKGLKKRVESLG